MTTHEEHRTNDPALPAWLVAPVAYEPPHDRAGFLRRNVLALTSALRVLRADPRAHANTSLDRFLAGVSPALRLTATFLLVLCISLAYNMAFVWIVLAGWLVLLALMPARRIRAVFVPALGVALVTLLVNLPALLLGQTTTPVRMASKTLATVGVIACLATSLGTEGLLAALRALHLPRRLVMMLDIAVRDVIALGESAVSLSEALALRSVGKDRTKTASAAGVMGVVFVRAHALATARSEAMMLRGYDGQPVSVVTGSHLRLANVAYVLVWLCLVGLFVYLEMAAI